MKLNFRKRTNLTAVNIVFLLWTALGLCGANPVALAKDLHCAQPEKTLLLAEAGFSAGELKPLVGRWLRPDGGYILEIRQSTPDGNLEAYYFNPRSINVHQAKVSRDSAGLKVLVELRDAGYPGSSYALLYRPDKDVLVGYYYQAGQKQYFEVYFVRQE